MILTILGLLVTALTAIYSAIASDESGKTKKALVGLALCGLAVGSWGAFDADKKSTQAALEQAQRYSILREEADSAAQQLAIATSSLDNQRKLLDYVSNTVGQLSKLNDLAGGRTYYVRVAWGNTPEELRRYESLLLEKFPGGKRSGLITVRPTDPRGQELVFGTGLTLASAEIFKRTSDPYANPPGHAEIRAELTSKTATPRPQPDDTASAVPHG